MDLNHQFGPSGTLNLNPRGHGTGTEGTESTSTIAPYHSALNGVNQPMNLLFKDMLWWTLGIMGLTILAVRLVEILWMHIRQVSSMSVAGERQNFWKYSQWSWLPTFKRHFLYAPLWKKRHNREIKLSAAMNMGTLPSRFHFVLLSILIGSNIIYMFVLNWQNENMYSFCAELRGRSGTLSMVNMVPLIFLAARNNLLIPWLKVSFDTYNLIHRWLGRLVVIEAVIHTIAWLIVQIADGGWGSVGKRIMGESFISSGVVGTISLLLILVLSFSPVRHAFYETFLNLHIILAFVIFVCTWVHCAVADIGALPQLPWIMGIMCLWFAERLWRMINLALNNWSSKGYTEAVVEVMPGETTRVTMHLPRYVDVKPGTHAYVRFKSIRPWESHPFSIAWVEHTPSSKALPVTEKESSGVIVDKKRATTSVSFVIGAQTGFTRKLYEKAALSGTQMLHMRAAMEGPYGGHHSLDSYGHVVLFAGSTGITHQISYLRPLIEGYNAGTVATRRITLVWIVRDYEALEWVRPWMDTILRLPNRKDILRIQLFITRPKNPREITSASETVQLFPGRPNIPMLLRKEVREQQGALCVTVCGAGALADDVRSASREVQDEGTVVDFIEESFTW
ncbi:hypothetical protein jhhlp_004152 [Lomentospora prolificans]|uniref:FAD-binding FR-type domain-containing protein n=1 Tax=Lomentospora prolificans TaxID=41688 RepID=A0A2N3NAQ4_9PEZI|nr:hypothetical protein jhhlp_004152 [Lomentospora prolificans]